MTQIRLVQTNARGLPVGESQPMCLWPDRMVAQAKAMHASGMAACAIARKLGGPSRWTVWRWVTGQARLPAARVVARRVKASEVADGESAQHPQPVGLSATEAPCTHSSTHKFEDALSDLA